MNIPRHAALALTAAVALTGCASITDPAATSPPAPAHTTTTTADPVPAPERGGTIPAPARQAQTQLAKQAGNASPQAALNRYASLWSDWTATTIVARQRQLAVISLGQARAQALQAAASFAHDHTLTKSHVANHGSVIAVTSSLITSGDWVIVTRESTTGQGDYQGLPATVHVTYAQLTHTPHGYVISQWSPQN
jgi:hypothetical protein